MITDLKGKDNPVAALSFFLWVAAFPVNRWKRCNHEITATAWDDFES